jgi:hypothetical protein
MMDGLSEDLADMSKLPRPVPKKVQRGWQGITLIHILQASQEKPPHTPFLFSTPHRGLE